MSCQILPNSAPTGVNVGWRTTRTGWTPAGTGLITRAIARLFDWQDRAFERHHLAELSDHILRDIGLNRADLDH